MEHPTGSNRNAQVPTDAELERRLESLRPVPERSPAAVEQAERRFLAALDETFPAAASTGAQTPAEARGWARIFKSQQGEKQNMNLQKTPRFAFAGLALALLMAALLFGGAGAAFSAAQNAIPGDTLYPVKTGLEQARASLAADAATRAELYLEFAARRMDEIHRLASAGRFSWLGAASLEFELYLDRALAEIERLAETDPALAADFSRQATDLLARYAQALTALKDRMPEGAQDDVDRPLDRLAPTLAILPAAEDGEIEFTGQIEAIAGNTWTIAGRAVAITAQTEIKGALQAGDQAKVHAYFTAGVLTAREIEPARQTSAEPTATRAPQATTTETRPDPTATRVENRPAPSATPPASSGEIEFRGVVQQIGLTGWVIDGRRVAITLNTQIKGAIGIGDLVKVHATFNGSAYVAREIELARSGGDDRSGKGGGGDDHGDDDDDDDDD